MTAAIIIAAVALTIAAAALAFTLIDRSRRRRDVRRNGDGFVAWDWPLRPIDGHDHPDPPELQPEQSA